MKIKISVTPDIDIESWESNYGVTGAVNVRRDAQEYVTNLVTEHLRDLGLLVQEG